MNELAPRYAPICAICQRPVEHFHEMRNHMTMVTAYEVRCHGAIQRVDLSDMTVMRAGPDGVSMGMAFDTQRIK